MKLTSIEPPQLQTSDIDRASNSQAETLSSLCNWWMNTKEEALPGICHWFIHPQKNQRGSSLRINVNRATNISSFSPIGHSENVDMSAMNHSHHSSISLILILGGVLFILLITAFVTCITRKKRIHKSAKKDHPPDYVSVIKMKKKEDEELPTYSEAITIEKGFESPKTDE